MIRAAGPAVFEFGGFRLEPQHRLLSRDGEPVVVTDKAFDALVYLIDHAGQLVTKDDLIKALWPDIVVEENNLYVVISTLRKALKDESGGATPDRNRRRPRLSIRRQCSGRREGGFRRHLSLRRRPAWHARIAEAALRAG